MKKLFHTIGLLGLFLNGFGQQIKLTVKPDSVQSELSAENEFEDMEMATAFIKQQVDSLFYEGYLGVSVDTLLMDSVNLIAHITRGAKYNFGSLQNGNLDESLFREELKFTRSNELSWGQVRGIRDNVLNGLVEKGHLNASVWLDDIEFDQQTINASLYANLGDKYIVDSLQVKGDVILDHTFLKKYFKLEDEQPLSERLLDQIQQRAAQSSIFVLKGRPAFVLKNNAKSDIVLNLEKRKANAFDLIFGVIPNPVNSFTDRKVRFTGEGKLNLVNPFGGGRRLGIDYKQLEPESPRINLDFEWPYLFNRLIGFDGSFNLYKQDTSFVNVDFDVGGGYSFGGNNEVSFFWNRTSSFLQNIDTATVKNTRSLPPSIDYSQNLYGVKLNFDKRNAFRSPTDGYFFNVRGAVGNREIERSSDVSNLQDPNDPTFNFSDLYEGLNDRKLTAQGQILAEKFFPFKERSTILVRNRTGLKFLSNYFENDLYRMGGINDIRGFDEQSLLASKFNITTLEYRFLLSQESFVSAFTDGGFFNDDRMENDGNFSAIGFGGGLDLATNAGIFKLNLAVGKQGEQSFDFNRARIHIGYINVF